MKNKLILNHLRRATLLGTVAIFLPISLLADEVMTITGGRVGIGESLPTAPLDVLGNVTSIGSGNALIRLSHPGGHAFQLDDTGHAGFWNFSNAVSETRFRISKSTTGLTELELTQLGDLTIRGSITTGGPSCGSGCDRVFDPDYDLLSIGAHAEQMWQNKHLPAIGPTVPSKPVNLSDQYGNMLNELETAHIYIAQQHESILQLSDEKETLKSKVDSLESRLSELEALLSR